MHDLRIIYTRVAVINFFKIFITFFYSLHVFCSNRKLSFFSFQEIFNFYEDGSCIFLLVNILTAWEPALRYRFWGIRPENFPSEDGKYVAYEGKNGWKGVYFPPELAFILQYSFMKVLLPIYSLIWRLNNFVSR